MRAVFLRKEPEVTANEFCVEKVITLPADEYAEFSQNLLRSYDFIREHKELMCETDGVWHCLLVTGEGMEEGILVESEGSAYARYYAFVPSIKGLIEQYQTMRETQNADMEMKM